MASRVPGSRRHLPQAPASWLSGCRPPASRPRRSRPRRRGRPRPGHRSPGRFGGGAVSRSHHRGVRSCDGRTGGLKSRRRSGGRQTPGAVTSGLAQAQCSPHGVTFGRRSMIDGAVHARMLPRRTPGRPVIRLPDQRLAVAAHVTADRHHIVSPTAIGLPPATGYLRANRCAPCWRQHQCPSHRLFAQTATTVLATLPSCHIPGA